ncbi:MAG: hypothetical protein H6706_22325 [Myxococcales bacterium]|nr:hypothetical protein [Myxococcales bacterium]
MHPARALSHPAWWLALALLAANDHLFKGAGVLPPALTGKLSDFAGLLVAPALLAVLVRARTQRGWLAAHAAVGAGFAAINLAPAAARAWEAAFAWTPLPWAITVDPTDLVALPMLAVSAVVLGRWARRPAPVGAALRTAGLALGGVACAATSPPPEPPFQPQAQFPWVQSRLVVANRSAVTQIVRVRALRPGVQVDCDAAWQQPGELLARELFSPAQTWLLDGGRALPVGDGTNTCGAFLIDGPEIPARLVVAFRYGPVQLSTDASRVANDRALFLDTDADGLAWAPHPALFLPQDDALEAPVGRCAPVPDGFGVSWSMPPVGTAVILDHTAAPDGCHAFDLAFRDSVERWFACLPELALPFGVEDTVRIGTLNRGQSGWPVDGVTVEGPGGRLVLTRGADLPPLGQTDVDLDTCERGARDACGGYEVALTASFTGPDGERVAASVGEPVLVGASTLVVARAVWSLAVDTACSAGPSAGGRWFEAAAVTPLGAN